MVDSSQPFRYANHGGAWYTTCDGAGGAFPALAVGDAVDVCALRDVKAYEQVRK